MRERIFGPETDDETVDETADSEQTDTTVMPDLQSKESAKQRGQGLKILTPHQMLSRLTITLAQLKAGNNSEKLLKNDRYLIDIFFNGLINTI